MRSESHHLVADLLLEAGQGCHCDDHHRQSESDTYDSNNIYGSRERGTFPSSLYQSLCYEIWKVHFFSDPKISKIDPLT